MIQRSSGEYLIQRADVDPPRGCAGSGTVHECTDAGAPEAEHADDGPPGAWAFPGDWVADGESPEATVRRLARQRFGLTIDVELGQPPLVGHVHGQSALLRYMFCAPRDEPERGDEPKPDGGGEPLSDGGDELPPGGAGAPPPGATDKLGLSVPCTDGRPLPNPSGPPGAPTIVWVPTANLPSYAFVEPHADVAAWLTAENPTNPT